MDDDDFPRRLRSRAAAPGDPAPAGPTLAPPLRQLAEDVESEWLAELLIGGVIAGR
jgi:hypothetical protein